MKRSYKSLSVERKDQIATIRMTPLSESLAVPGADLHWDIASVLSELREDNRVRVLILTGSTDREFLLPPSPSMHASGRMRSKSANPVDAWRTFMGIVRAHQLMAEIEKPVIARVNGDAMGFGLSLALACDFIVATEEAVFRDHHLALDELEGFERDWGIVPGDGGVSLAPLYFSPPKAKEFLMLAEPWTGRDLAAAGLINSAVPKDRLDELTEQYAHRLLKRSAYALAWTKRVANRHIVQQLNLTLDAGVAYEMVNYLQREFLDGQDKKSLD